MRKLFLVVYSIFFCTTYTLGMEITAPENFPYDLKKKILFDAVGHLDKYIDVPPFSDCAYIKSARKFVLSVSLVNKTCYNHVNSPQIIRKIINNIANNVDEQTEYIARNLRTPGAKNYITCSQKLFFSMPSLAPKKIEDLVRDGADVNYSKKSYVTILMYLLINPDHFDYLKVMETILKLGANIDRCEWIGEFSSAGAMEPLLYAIKKGSSIEEIKLLLHYNPKNKHLDAAIRQKNIKLIELLLAAGASPDEGFSLSFYDNTMRSKEKMKFLQLFLDKGATPTAKHFAYAYQRAKHNKMGLLELLCNHGACDEQVLQKTYVAKEKLNRIIALLEKNKPSDKMDYHA